jgi:hypothetical protein
MDAKPDCGQKEVISLIFEKKTNETAGQIVGRRNESGGSGELFTA